MSKLSLSSEQIDYLLSPDAIRDRARAIFDYTVKGEGHFNYNESKFKSVVDYVMKVIAEKYPDTKIPFHSRWGHFRVGGIDRPAKLKAVISSMEPLERARVELDLVITSVLLDAGAGAAWSYREAASNAVFARSEGLGVASFDMFQSGVLSADRKSLRADADGLKKITARDVDRHFQVHEDNPLIGVGGRVALLNGLGRAVENRSLFQDGRPGNIVDLLIARHGRTIPATGILRAVLDGFGPIWPGRLVTVGSYGEVNLGDVWRHSKLASQTSIDSLVPLHKLSQWMTYSLIEPMIDAGLKVEGVEKLTGLAEYRNGGLLVDLGLIVPRDPKAMAVKWAPDSDLIIEWRALTVYFLDLIGREVQKALGKSPEEFPLAKVLEGGTWWAGRAAAKERRSNGDPPLQIASDGTVF